MSSRKQAVPLSQRLRDTSKKINVLLEQYSVYRHGDATYRNGKDGGENGGKAPCIYVISTPKILLLNREKTTEKEKNDDVNDANNIDNGIQNPTLKALMSLGELNENEAKEHQLRAKVNILHSFGVAEQLQCGCLIEWVRELAGEITYLLETRSIYSEEIKAKYPELLTDLEVARGYADNLARKLALQNGVLTAKQYSEIVGALLHYTRIIQTGALQLADHHEEFMGRGVVSPLEGEEIEWVLKETPKPSGTPETKIEGERKR